MASDLSLQGHDYGLSRGVTPTLDLLVAVSVLDTVYVFDLTFMVVRLNQCQLQILFSNILDFLDFSRIFLNYFRKSLNSGLTEIDNRL